VTRYNFFVATTFIIIYLWC